MFLTQMLPCLQNPLLDRLGLWKGRMAASFHKGQNAARVDPQLRSESPKLQFANFNVCEFMVQSQQEIHASAHIHGGVT